MIRKPLVRLARRARSPFLKYKLALKQSLGWLETPVVVPYRGFGHCGRFTLQGHVLENSGLARPQVEHSVWRNALAMLKRYAADSLPGITVQATYQGQIKHTTTDDDGHFTFSFERVEPSSDETWQTVAVEIIDDVVPDQPPCQATAEVMLPRRPGAYGVISDVDDTILVSYATQALRKLRLMLFRNATTRLPFSGVAAFYRALHRGAGGACYNPIFFVSSSEWNLYDLLVDFCQLRGIPKGPFLLQEYKTLRDFLRSGGGSHYHKLVKIRRIMDTYPDLPFVLIGDSGQRDAEIYAQVVNEYPGRVLSIYVRDVARRRHRRRVERVARQLVGSGVEMLLVPDTAAAARHAANKGLIDVARLGDVDRELAEHPVAAVDALTETIDATLAGL